MIWKGKAMKYLQNRKIAMGITCIMIFCSILFGAFHSLTRLRNQALDVFYQGENTSGKGIQADLEYMADACHNLTVVAGRYLDKKNERVKEVKNNRDLFLEANTPGDKYKAMESLLNASKLLYEELGIKKLSERDQKYRNDFAVNIKSRQLIISHSNYNERAVAFNNCLKQFPANILSKVTFVKSLELYQ